MAFFAEGADAEEARAAGADIVGGLELIEQIASKNWTDPIGFLFIIRENFISFLYLNLFNESIFPLKFQVVQIKFNPNVMRGGISPFKVSLYCLGLSWKNNSLRSFVEVHLSIGSSSWINLLII